MSPISSATFIQRAASDAAVIDRDHGVPAAEVVRLRRPAGADDADTLHKDHGRALAHPGVVQSEAVTLEGGHALNLPCQWIRLS